MLQDEDRFLRAVHSSHDYLSRLALTIEPDQQQTRSRYSHICAVIETIPVDEADHQNLQLEFDHLRSRLEHLQRESRQLDVEINILKKDYAVSMANL